MSFIYIDESGDLGTKSSSSRYFVMVAIKIDDSRKLEILVNKIRKISKNEIGYMNELKGFNLPNDIIKKIFKNLNKFDYETFIVVFDKSNRYKLKDIDNNLLYDLIASELANLININEHTFVFVDKTKNKDNEIKNFNKMFTDNLCNYKNYSVSLNHVNSMNFKGLQIADLISWSIFQSVEHENDEFIDLIKNKTIKKVF
ncbi:DUF3800 domain-containing protein [Methanobrevibacter sp.]|uniref:DUF3800 domain-containing protein n=1 Tax=Methanobrevibacter sp. TaxID=66852 RepID=UPI003869D027